MRVSCVNNYNANPNFQGYTFRKNRCPIYLNPIKYQVDKLFDRSLTASRYRISPIAKDLQPFLEEVPLRAKGVDTYAYDITNENGTSKYVLMLHGLGQNISALQPLFRQIITRTDYSVFAPEYRAFGKNPPETISNETFLKDTQAAFDYLVKDKGINPQDICVVGHSFGGFTASQLVKKNPDIGRLILVAPLDNFGDEMVRSSMVKHVSPFALTLLRHIRLLRAYLKSLFNTKKQLEKSTVPVDIIHSMNDRVISYKTAQYLAESSLNLQGMHLLKTGGHVMEEKKIAAIVTLLK